MKESLHFEVSMTTAGCFRLVGQNHSALFAAAFRFLALCLTTDAI